MNFTKTFLRAVVRLFLLMLVLSCGKEQRAKYTGELDQNTEQEAKGESLPIKMQPPKRLTSSNIELKKNTDEDLKKRAAEYFKAIHNDDFDKELVTSFMYPGIFSYVKNNNRGHYYETDLLKSIKGPVEELKAMVRKANASYQMDVEGIGRRLNSGDKKIYFLKFSMTIKKGMNSYTLTDQILGVSLNGYEEWTFLEANESAPYILESEFPRRTINELKAEIQRIGD